MTSRSAWAKMASETQVGAYGVQRGPLLKRHIQAEAAHKQMNSRITNVGIGLGIDIQAEAAHK